MKTTEQRKCSEAILSLIEQFTYADILMALRDYSRESADTLKDTAGPNTDVGQAAQISYEQYQHLCGALGAQLAIDAIFDKMPCQ